MIKDIDFTGKLIFECKEILPLHDCGVAAVDGADSLRRHDARQELADHAGHRA